MIADVGGLGSGWDRCYGSSWHGRGWCSWDKGARWARHYRQVDALGAVGLRLGNGGYRDEGGDQRNNVRQMTYLLGRSLW